MSMLRTPAFVARRRVLPPRSDTMSNPNDQITPEMLDYIATRLRPVCPDIPESEFELLVLDVARVKLQSEGDKYARAVQHHARSIAPARRN
jgi:hypothetical protein